MATIVSRLGMFIYWAANGIAALLVAVCIALLLFSTIPAGENILVWLAPFFLCAGFVWLVGRALKYILVGK